MQGCVVTDLTVHSKNNCFVFSPDQMKALENTAVSFKLEPGTNIIKIRSGSFNYQSASGHTGEPVVMLWIYGGKVMNRKTGVQVGATWSSLNGYDDSLVLEVAEPATMSAFFFDTHLDDNAGEVLLSVVKI